MNTVFKIFSWLFNLGWLSDGVDFLNGKKTYLALISLALHVLNVAPAFFPELGIPVGLAEQIHSALLSVGIILLPLGVGGKVSKLGAKITNGKR